MSLPSLPLTALEHLRLARWHAQRAADLARSAGVMLERRDKRRFAEVANGLHEWSLRETALLTLLMERVRRLGG